MTSLVRTPEYRRKKLFVGIWLAILYVICIFIGTAALSSLYLDYQIATISSSENNRKVERLHTIGNIVENKKKIEHERFAEFYKLEFITVLRNAFPSEISLDTGVISPDCNLLSEVRDAIILQINLNTSWNSVKERNSKDTLDCIDSYIANAKKNENVTEALNALTLDERKKVAQSYEEYLKKPTWRTKDFFLKTIENNVGLRKQRIENLNLQLKNADKEYDDIRPVLSQITQLAKLFGSNADENIFANLPSIYLTLVAVMVMGAIGSLITLTKTYFSEEIGNTSVYLIYPFLGMLSALAVLILFKSGQLVIATGSAIPGTQDLVNPFFVSFIGLISGAFADQAYMFISSTGSKFFGSNMGANRWAVRVMEEIDSQKKSVDDLRQHIDSVNVDKWIHGEMAVPEFEQRIIAAWLNCPRRELFSDISPFTEA